MVLGLLLVLVQTGDGVLLRSKGLILMALRRMRFIAMILNNVYSVTLLSMLAISMLAFIVLFGIFIYKDLGGVKFGRDSFLFFDYVFFCSNWRANASALSIFGVFVFGCGLNYIQNINSANILIDLIWLIGIILFFIHCRFLSNVEYEHKKGIAFAKELFLNIKINPRLILLWGARILFSVLIAYRFYR